jgi:hypothetical protein
MSNNRYQDWSKRTKEVQKQALNAPSVWDNSVEEEQKTIEEVKQQWQNKQHRQFKRIQTQENEHKNIKVIVSSLVSITLIAIALPHLPAWWQIGKNTYSELFTKEIEANSDKTLKKGGFLDKIKKLHQKQAEKENNQENSVIKDDTQKKAGKATIADQLEESVDNIDKYNEESVDNIDKYNNDLQKAIDLSDGKEASLEEEKK